MDRVTTINYKGIEILYSDFSNLKTIDEISQVFNSGSEIITNAPLNSVLGLSNFENTFFNSQIIKVIQEALKRNKLHIKSSAIIGINGLAKVMFDGIIRITGRDLRLFKTMEEANEFLYQKSKS